MVSEGNEGPREPEVDYAEDSPRVKRKKVGRPNKSERMRKTAKEFLLLVVVYAILIYGFIHIPFIHERYREFLRSHTKIPMICSFIVGFSLTQTNQGGRGLDRQKRQGQKDGTVNHLSAIRIY